MQLITATEYRRLVLESADEDGRLYPPRTVDWFAGTSQLMRMYVDGFIEKRGDGPMWNRVGPWFITEKGRATHPIHAQEAGRIERGGTE